MEESIEKFNHENKYERIKLKHKTFLNKNEVTFRFWYEYLNLIIY